MRISKSPYCGAINCSNNKGANPELSFFYFPKDPERCKKWAINCRRKDLLRKDVIYLHTNVRLCSNHFEQTQFMNVKRNSLVWNAIPTIFDIPNPPKSLSVKRKLPKRIVNSKQCKTSSEKYADYSKYESDLEIVEAENEDTKANNSKDEQLSAMRNEILKLKRTLRLKINELSRVKIKYRKLKLSTPTKFLNKKTSKNTDIKTLEDIASKYLKKDALQFFISQIKTAKESQNGFRWSDENKLFALSLLHRSSKGYKFLKEHFSLPSVRTLQKFIEGVHLQAGLNNEIIALLKEKIKNFSNSESQ